MKRNRITRVERPRRKTGKSRRVSAGGVYAQFLNELLEGSIVPGERLGEPTLAARWQVSRPPVRDALIRLECEGLVERRAKSGTYVRSMDVSEVEELYDLRAVIECFVVRKLCKTVTDADLDELQQLAVQADAANMETMSAQEVIERESRFHLKLCELAQLRHALRLLNMPSLLLSTLRMALQQQIPFTAMRQHQELVEVLRTRDARRCEKFVMMISQSSKQELIDSIRAS